MSPNHQCFFHQNSLNQDSPKFNNAKVWYAIWLFEYICSGSNIVTVDLQLDYEQIAGY